MSLFSTSSNKGKSCQRLQPIFRQCFYCVAPENTLKPLVFWWYKIGLWSRNGLIIFFEALKMTNYISKCCEENRSVDFLKLEMEQRGKFSQILKYIRKYGFETYMFLFGVHNTYFFHQGFKDFLRRTLFFVFFKMKSFVFLASHSNQVKVQLFNVLNLDLGKCYTVKFD